MKKILYVCVGTLAIGEMENALRFARDLEKGGFSSHFLVLPFGVPFIKKACVSFDELGYRKKDNHRIFKEVCQRVKPDWILVADGCLFDFWLGPRYLFDLDWVLDNPVKARFATFDYFGLSLKEATLTIHNNPAVEDKFRLLHTTNLTKVMPVLVPCPFGFTPVGVSNGKPGVFYYRRSTEELKWDEIRKKIFRTLHGLEKDEKLILFSMARWALQAAQAVTENLGEWLNHFSRMMEVILQRVQSKTTIIVVSAYPLLSNVTRGNLKIINRGFLPMDTYIKYLTVADLYITTNALSNSIIQAVMSKVPAAALISSGRDFRVNNTIPPELIPWFEVAEKRFPDLIRPYFLFPLGWNEVAESLFENNPITDAFEFLDITDPVGSMNTINDILFNTEKRASLSERQERYKNEIAHLPDPEGVMVKLTESF